MSEVNRFPGESPGPYGRFTTPTNPPAKPRSRLWPRLLAIAATVAVLAITGAVFLSANTATAGTGTILAATSPIVAETQPASAYSGAIQASAIAAKVDPAVVDVNTVFQTATRVWQRRWNRDHHHLERRDPDQQSRGRGCDKHHGDDRGPHRQLHGPGPRSGSDSRRRADPGERSNRTADGSARQLVNASVRRGRAGHR